MTKARVFNAYRGDIVNVCLAPISLLLLFFCGFLTACNDSRSRVDAQNVISTTSNTAEVQKHWAKVVGDLAPLAVGEESSHEKFLNHPTPSVFVCLFSEEAASRDAKSDCAEKVEISEEGYRIATEYWRHALYYRLYYEVEKPQTAEEMRKAMLALLKSADTAIVRLQQTTVEAREGRRNLSYNEANEVIAFLSQNAEKLSTELRNANKKTPIA